MKFSGGFRTAYWLGLIAILSWFLLLRMDDAVAGRATAADTVVFGIWIALLLAPLFSEIELLGIKLKQEVEKAKDEIKREIVALKTEITSAIEVRTNISPNIYLTAPPDAQLPAIARDVRRAVALESSAIGGATRSATVHGIDGDTLFLVAVRRDLEVELRRIVEQRDLPRPDRPLSGVQLVRLLGQAEILGPDLVRAVRDLYAICSPAVHGEAVSAAQLALVRDLGPDVLGVL